jgi:hypothetical protein
MIFTVSLKRKLKSLVDGKVVSIGHIERYSGVHRWIVSRFLSDETLGINYENGMALRTYYLNFKNQRPMEIKKRPVKEV